MKKLNIILGIVFSIIIFGCAERAPNLKTLSLQTTQDHIKSESEQLDAAQKEFIPSLERVSPRVIHEKPVMPLYDPLEDHTVSFSMINEDLKVILYSLSQSVGMNLIIDPVITLEEKQLTLNFQNVSASTVLREILNTYDLYYEIHGNIIRIRPFKEQMFSLDFLDTRINTNFNVGGDVLGASEETTSGLKGKFELSGQAAKQGNDYDVIEQMITRIISKDGKYSLNRLSGSLYVKDTPAIIRSISKLINHFKRMLSRQILIEARIIEVGLSDKYEYGIDWSVLRDEAASLTTKTNVAWSLGSGLVLSHENNEVSIDSAMDALETFGKAKVVSNPSIRVKHGKPALISVGTSFTYKKTVETTREVTSGTDREITDVEVSTVFDGLILGVIPFIGENQRISLLINPINSSVNRESLEPKSVGGGSQEISLPEVRIKEMSTTIELEDGDVVVLGGLIDDIQTTQEAGVPILSRLPILGYLFKNELKSVESKELVIILSVKLV
ncbi:MAG: pilus (MSHA type) biogenesis protein MshL [Deltaproteobacteria bacterium]|nr:pilus (MSHA type) biogenesis protein MshL [Deltaproteobacteria bacterium]MBW2087506.1 pilus (MSHA type) biogenesis protein MshL [Deltaproteobacteria bacterium]MBW2319651.1 pilus (MSHA type) biogenesis protein MshL [Deltaproteobacteria bacterium]